MALSPVQLDHSPHEIRWVRAGHRDCSCQRAIEQVQIDELTPGDILLGVLALPIVRPVHRSKLAILMPMKGAMPQFEMNRPLYSPRTPSLATISAVYFEIEKVFPDSMLIVAYVFRRSSG